MSQTIFNVKHFGAKGDGATNDAAAIQSAINAAKAAGAAVYIPSASAGYLCSTALDVHNSDRLTIYGDGALHPAFGLEAVAPTKGSLLIGNTGSSGSIIDAVGANGFKLRGVTLSSLGAATPSRIGIVAGTSNRVTAGAPGSAFNEFSDVAIWLTQMGNSIPMYCNNTNLSHFGKVTTLGDTGIVFETGNPRSITPPFATFGSDIENDGNVFENVSLLAYGIASDQPALWLHKANNLRGNVYIANLAVGPSYAGFAYSMYAAGCFDVDLLAEVDYFPSVVYLEEFLSNVRFRGTSFPSTTPIGVDIPVIAFFHTTGVDQCDFKVTPVMGAVVNSNFHYTTTGGNPGFPDHIKNSSFSFDSTVSTNVAFFNMSSSETVPLWSNRIEGDIDGITNTLLIDNSVMGSTHYRMFLNGIQIGTA